MELDTVESDVVKHLGSGTGVTEEGVYFIEKIVDKRTRNGTIEYCIEWRNVSHEHNTWLPIDNLNCRQLIIEYETQARLENNAEKISCNGIFSDSTIAKSESIGAGEHDSAKMVEDSADASMKNTNSQ